MKNKKTIVILIILLLGIGSFFILKDIFKTEKVGILPFFLTENDKKATEEIKKLKLEQKLEQLLFIETQEISNLPASAGMIFYSGNRNSQYDSLLAKYENQKMLKPIFSNLYTDGLCHFQSVETALNIHHFFANTDTSILNQLNEFVIDLNQSMQQNLHFFSFINLLPDKNIDSIFYKKLLEKSIKTTQFSEKKKILNGHICHFQIKNLKQDTLKLKKELRVVRELITNRIPVLLLSNPTIETVSFLRKNLSFEGIIISDFRNKKIPKKEEINEFIQKGNTFFLISEKTNVLKENLSYFEKKLPQKKLDIEIKRILQAKIWLQNNKTLVNENLCSNNSINLLTNKLIENSMSILRNKDKVIPLISVINKIPVLNIGTGVESFNQMLKNFVEIELLKPDFSKDLQKNKSPYFVVTINKKILEKIDKEYLKKISALKGKKALIVINLGSLENLILLKDFKNIIQTYGNSEFEQQICAQALMGGTAFNGSLPNYFKEKKQFGDTIITKKNRLKYAQPEEVNMNSQKLSKIDSIAQREIELGSFPGCQVFVAYKGVIVYNKQFGYQTYSKKDAVKESDMYDLASLTKISATTLAAMKMFDTGKMNLNTTLSECMKNTKIDYTRIIPDTIIKIDTLLKREIPNLKKLVQTTVTINLNDSTIVTFDTIIAKLTPSRNIFKVKISEMMVHESGIMPVLPILPYILYKIPQKRKTFRIKTTTLNDVNDSLQNEPVYDTIYTMEKKVKRTEAFSKYYTRTKTDSSTMQIADNMYFKNVYRDTLWIETKQLNVSKEKKYQYSDVNMILVQMAIDSLNGKNINKYLLENFYDELGLKNTCFLPLEKHSRAEIVPTTLDKVWRNQLLHGYVHDPSAAMLGGIAGNAGLFSSAKEQGILYQMLLNKGTYGGKRYLSAETIEKFTKRQEGYVRALGFEVQSSKAIMSRYASPKTYGHTGFTGNCVWVDPENELVYVFLSNRVHPDSKNGKINGHRVRQKIHDAVYEAIEKK